MSNIGNKETLSKNLAYYLDRSGKTQKELAEIAGVAPSAITAWIQGTRYPRIDKIEKLADYFGILKSDLIEDQTPGTDRKLVSNLYCISTKQFPVLGNIACGEPILANNNIELYIEAGTNIQADFVLRAKGDSMIGARIQDGDFVFIRQQNSVNDGEIAAVLIGDEATLKRVYFDAVSGTLTLYAENPKYPTMRFSGEELADIRILGKAIAFQSDIR